MVSEVRGVVGLFGRPVVVRVLVALVHLGAVRDPGLDHGRGHIILPVAAPDLVDLLYLVQQDLLVDVRCSAGGYFQSRCSCSIRGRGSLFRSRSRVSALVTRTRLETCGAGSLVRSPRKSCCSFWQCSTFSTSFRSSGVSSPRSPGRAYCSSWRLAVLFCSLLSEPFFRGPPSKESRSPLFSFLPSRETRRARVLSACSHCRCGNGCRMRNFVSPPRRL